MKNTANGKTYDSNYTYVDIPEITGKTTNLIASVKNGNQEAYFYTYDKLGNIETVKKGTQQIQKFYYDG